MAFTEVLSTFFDTDDFAVAATIKTGAGVTVRTINVIFDQPRNELALLDARLESPLPFVRCQTADLAGIDHTHTMTINAVVYRIVKRDDDGTGVSTVQLRA